MDGLLHNNNKGKRWALESDTFHSSTKKKKGRWVLQYVEEDETAITTQQDNGLLQNSTYHMHNYYPNNKNNHLLTSHQYQPPLLPPPPYYPPHIMATAKALDKEHKMKKRIDMMEMELNKPKSSHNSINTNTQYRPPPIISKPSPPRPIAKRLSEVLTPSSKTMSHHNEKPRRKVAAIFTKNGYHPRIMAPTTSTKNNRSNSKTPPPPLVHQISLSTSYEDEKKKNSSMQLMTNRYTSNEPPLIHTNTTKLVERKRDVREERLRSESSSMADKKKAYLSRGLWYRTGVQEAVKDVKIQEAISTTREEVGSTNMNIKGKGDVGKGRIVHQDIIHTEGYKKRQDEVTMLLQMTNGYTFCGHRGCKNKASVGGLCLTHSVKHPGSEAPREASRMLQEAIQYKGTCHKPTDVNSMPADPTVLQRSSGGDLTPEEHEIRLKWKRMRDIQQRKVPWRKKYTYKKGNPSEKTVHRPETFLQRWERAAAKYDIANMNVDSPPKHFKRVESHSELLNRWV